jgi:pseudouridylate synthase
MKYIVDINSENMRLDKFIRKYSEETSLSVLFSLIRKGQIKVNSKKSKENYRLQKGDEIYLPESAKINFESKKNVKIYNNSLKEMIVFEDENIFVVNKPIGVAMHKGDGHEYGLSEMAKEYFKSQDVNFSNRLDIKTEGLVIGAKNLKFLRLINEEIREKRVVKKYIAKVKKGNLKLNDEFMSNKKLLVTNNKVIVSNKGLDSLTYFKVYKIENNMAFIDIDLKTGRKHQIRVHLSDLGYSIVGDDKYGDYSSKDRLYLKCYKIKFLKYNIEIDKYFL